MSGILRTCCPVGPFFEHFHSLARGLRSRGNRLASVQVSVGKERHMILTQRGIVTRLMLGVSGQTFARIATVLNTVILVPVLINAWGTIGYGQWIAIGAFSSYLAYSNFGLVTPTANEIIMAVGAGDTVRARRAFQMSINVALYIIFPFMVLIVIGIHYVPISQILNLTQLSNEEALIIVALFAAQLWFSTLQGIIIAALYATGSYGFGYYINGVSKLLELATIATVVQLFHGMQVSAAGIMVSISILNLLVVFFYARLVAQWAKLNFAVFDRAWLQYLLKPTIGFMISNLSTQGLLVQAPRVILSVLLGGEAVALYAVYATAVRLVDQLFLLIAQPLEIEISRSAGANDSKKILRLIILGTQFSWLLFVVVALTLVTLGPFIIEFWTNNRIPFSLWLILLFLLMAACNHLGRVSWLALISVNQMFGISFVMVAFSTITMAFGGLLAILIGVPGMVIGGVIGEFLNSISMIYVLTKWLDKPINELFWDVLNFKISFQEIRSIGTTYLKKIQN